MPSDERAGDCCPWYRSDLAFYGNHFHTHDGKRLDPRLVEPVSLATQKTPQP